MAIFLVNALHLFLFDEIHTPSGVQGHMERN